MILFHTAFKFGGIVSISFWSMVAVVASGVLGRFIYLQIPRTIHGQELSMHEIQEARLSLVRDIEERLSGSAILIGDVIQESGEAHATNNKRRGFLGNYMDDWKKAKSLRKRLQNLGINKDVRSKVLSLITEEWALNRKKDRLLVMQRYFRYWHIAHLPFALIMLVIMIIHVGVTLAFGYKWIF
jgi:hypothetical protein